MHVDEDLAELAVVVFAGAQIDLVAADDGLLGVALAAVRQLLAVARSRSMTRSTIFSTTVSTRAAMRLGEQRLGHVLGLFVVIGDELRGRAAATAWSRRGRARWP